MLAIIFVAALALAIDPVAPWLARMVRAARRERLAEWHAYLDSKRRD